MIVWRFSGRQLLSHAAEERAQRLVGVPFFLLAPYVAFEASGTWSRTTSRDERPGMVLRATSLVRIPFLGIATQRLAETLGSSARHGEGAQNLLCAYLAAAVFLGLAGTALFGWWWLDPIAALVVAGVAVKEGRATWRGAAASHRSSILLRQRARTTAATELGPKRAARRGGARC